jgi:hypothetical protein
MTYLFALVDGTSAPSRNFVDNLSTSRNLPALTTQHLVQSSELQYTCADRHRLDTHTRKKAVVHAKSHPRRLADPGFSLHVT